MVERRRIWFEMKKLPACPRGQEIFSVIDPTAYRLVDQRLYRH